MQVSTSTPLLQAVLVSTRGNVSTHGTSPAAHLGDGCCDVILVEPANQIKLLANIGRICLSNHRVC